MALGSAQPLTGMRSISLRVKAAGAWGRQPCHLHVPIVMKAWSLNFLESSWPVQACIFFFLISNQSTRYSVQADVLAVWESNL